MTSLMRVGPRARRAAAMLHASLLLSAQLLVLSACVSGGGKSGAYRVGPTAAGREGREVSTARAAHPTNAARRPDVIIPVFDPGLSEDAENYEAEGIWPELRRAEANRFAFKMKRAMEQTGEFGAVRVTPDRTASGELYVLGKIITSDGAEVEIELEVVDISGKRWMREEFSHGVGTGFHKNTRNKNKDPYDPVFEEAAEEIAKLLRRRKPKELDNLRAITELRFGQYLVADAFNEHLRVKNQLHTLTSLPSDDDAQLKRVRATRVREQLFVDNMQSTYAAFSEQMETSYLKWQEASLLETHARKKAGSQSLKRLLAGVALIGVAVAAGVASSKAESGSVGSVAGATGAVASGLAASWMLSKAFQSKEEAKLHQGALSELGESLDLELAPRVVKLEEQSVQLQGDASEQFAQWRAFLKKLYEQEKTPDIIL